jgi:hypothetical protein
LEGAALATERVERRLAAILAADVAGYSRLMGADEEGTTCAAEGASCANRLIPRSQDIAGALSAAFVHPRACGRTQAGSSISSIRTTGGPMLARSASGAAGGDERSPGR